MRQRLTTFFLLAITAVSVGGWGWELHARAGIEQERAFDQRRFALVESENARLNQLLVAADRERVSAEDRSRRMEVEQDVEKIRDLKFLQPVEYDEVSHAGILGVMEQKLSDVYTDQEFSNLSTSLAALGMLPSNYPLKQGLLKLLSEQVAAFYDPHAHKLFMFDEARLNSPQNRVVLAHELTHALQDQHFGLLKLPLEIKDNDDRAAAASALIEGDATVVMSLYMLQNLSLGAVTEQLAQAMKPGVAQLSAAPLYLRQSLLFPYVQGQAFCTAIQAHGGFAELSRVYAAPPQSTSEILHPELYLAEPRLAPIAINFADPHTLSQSPIDQNVAGEWGMRVLLTQWLDEPAAISAAAGWRGDRYLVYGDATTAEVLWKSAWSSPDEAAEYAAAMQHYFDKRYPGGAHRKLLVRVEDQTFVRVVDASDDAWLKALAEKP